MGNTKLEINGDDKIEEYEFLSLDGILQQSSDQVKEYEIGELEGYQKEYEKQKRPILKLEKDIAREKKFNISPIVKKFRGIKKIEKEEYNLLVKQELNKKLKKTKDSAYDQGYVEGKDQGIEDVYKRLGKETDDKINTLKGLIDEILESKKSLITKQRHEVYELIRALVKWVILRELKDDGEYINRLLEKLLLELKANENILIKVNKENFKSMPEIIENVEKSVGKLENVRVEFVTGESFPGITLESENGILVGTMDAQLGNLDKLFESVSIKNDLADR